MNHVKKASTVAEAKKHEKVTETHHSGKESALDALKACPIQPFLTEVVSADSHVAAGQYRQMVLALTTWWTDHCAPML